MSARISISGDLQAIQLDALREVSNMGAGHAATALSQMTNTRIMINVPRLQVVPLEEVPEVVGSPDQVVAAVLMHMLGDLTGRTLLIFPRNAAMRLAEILLHREPGSLARVRRAGAVGDQGGRQHPLGGVHERPLRLHGAHAPPLGAVAGDRPAGAVLTTAYTNFGHERDVVFCIQTEFAMDGDQTVKGQFLLLPDLESLQIILQQHPPCLT
jgi:chemotaxis protein CheC